MYEKYGYIPYITLAISAVGLFGNVNIIVATYRQKKFRTKSGILIALLALFDSITLLGETLVVVRQLAGLEQIRRNECFFQILPFLFIQILGISMIDVLAVDRLFALIFPLRYRHVSIRLYVELCLLPGTMLSAGMVVVGALSTNSEFVPVCNPPMSYSPSTVVMYKRIGIMQNAFVLVVYAVVTIVLLTKRMKKKSKLGRSVSVPLNEWTALGTITTIVIAFIFTWGLAILVTSIFSPPRFSLEFANAVVAHSGMLVVSCYAQHYYVLLWRSREYRSEFLRQLSISPASSFQHSSATPATTVNRAFVITPSHRTINIPQLS